MPVDDDTLAMARLSQESDTVHVDGTTYAVGTAARHAAETAEEEPQPLVVKEVKAAIDYPQIRLTFRISAPHRWQVLRSASPTVSFRPH